jgi:hypothetical protein
MRLRIFPDDPIGRTAKSNRMDVHRVRKEIGQILDETGRRFSSTRSFKDRDPFRDTGKELVNGLEVFLFEVGELAENLFLGHSRGKVGSQIVDAEAQAADAGLSPILPASTVIRGFRVNIERRTSCQYLILRQIWLARLIAYTAFSDGRSRMLP